MFAILNSLHIKVNIRLFYVIILCCQQLSIHLFITRLWLFVYLILEK